MSVSDLIEEHASLEALTEEASKLRVDLPSVAGEVFRLLIDRGPLCASQVSAELMIGLQAVGLSLRYLALKGLVRKRPDAPGHAAVAEHEVPFDVG